MLADDSSMVPTVLIALWLCNYC